MFHVKQSGNRVSLYMRLGKQRYEPSEHDRRGYASRGGRGTARKSAEKSLFGDRLLNALCKQTAEPGERHRCTGTGEIDKRSVNADGGENDTGNDIGNKYARRSQLGAVNEHLSYGAEKSAYRKSLDTV